MTALTWKEREVRVRSSWVGRKSLMGGGKGLHGKNAPSPIPQITALRKCTVSKNRGDIKEPEEEKEVYCASLRPK